MMTPYQKQWAKLNKDKINSNQKKWRENNKEYYREYMKEYMKTYRKQKDESIKLKNRIKRGSVKLDKRKAPMFTLIQKPITLSFD